MTKKQQMDRTTIVKQWVETLTAGKSIRQVEAESGVPNTTIHRAIKSGKISTEHLVALARANGVNPVDILLQIGLLKKEEVARLSADQTVQSVPDTTFILELLRRFNSDMSHWAPILKLETLEDND